MTFLEFQDAVKLAEQKMAKKVSTETENHDFLPSKMAICAYDWAVLGHLDTQIRSIEPFLIKNYCTVGQEEQKDGSIKQYSSIIRFSWFFMDQFTSKCDFSDLGQNLRSKLGFSTASTIIFQGN